MTCDSEGVCSECVNGYQLYEGACACEFQNCLKCMGDSFCTVCAFPTTAIALTQSGCAPQIVSGTLCAVDNCMKCSIPNMCSECAEGYSLLKNGTCSRISCASDSNCLLCDER